MNERRSQLYVKIEKISNLRTLNTRKLYIRLTELNNKSSTSEHGFNPRNPFYISHTTFKNNSLDRKASDFPGIVITLGYSHNKKHEFLDEILIPFNLLVPKRSVKFYQTITPPNKKLVPMAEYPVLTFFVYDDVYPIGSPTPSTVSKDDYSKFFCNPPIPVDLLLKNNVSVKAIYSNLVKFYKENRQNKSMFSRRSYDKVLPEIDIGNPESINKSFEKLFSIEPGNEVSVNMTNATCKICLMKENDIFKIEGIPEKKFTVPIKQETPGQQLEYFFDFNYH